MPQAANTRLIFGCGYLGSRAAKLWHDAGLDVLAVTRSRQRAEELRRSGMSLVIADVTHPETLANLPAADAVLVAIGHDRHAGPDIHTVFTRGLENVLAALPPSTGRVIYISTTGVYGSANGGWVDETTPPDPQRDGGRASLAAEQALREHPLGRSSAILRLGGIYGPGRVPYLEQLRAGEPLPVPSAGWLNLIHVDDAARAIVAVDQWLYARPERNGPHTFCVTDGTPAPRADYYAEVARLVGAAPPKFCTPAADSPAAARAASDRRVSPKKMLNELNLTLAFPSYRHGLRAILDPDANC